ncbi:MAG: hypothetical protein IJ466_07185 [Clostridia bacterium]|nr:hypothetical protein [Clostridia bacterium]
MKKQVFKVIFSPRNETYYVKITPNKAIRKDNKVALHMLYVLAHSIGVILKNNISDQLRGNAENMVIRVIHGTAQKDTGDAE